MSPEMLCCRGGTDNLPCGLCRMQKGCIAMRTEAIPMEELAQILAVQLQHGTAPLRVTGSSMHPTFRHRRDTVMLRSFEGSLKKGDVVLFCREDGSYILHRAITTPDGESFLCVGDNQCHAEKVLLSQVVAVVESFQRGKKQVSEHNRLYRLYVWMLVALFPIRRPCLMLRRILGRLRKKLRK